MTEEVEEGDEEEVAGGEEDLRKGGQTEVLTIEGEEKIEEEDTMMIEVREVL